ncbi:MAG: hypothetical protein ACLR43_07465 [Faecalibacillus faecis]
MNAYFVKCVDFEKMKMEK